MVGWVLRVIILMLVVRALWRLLSGIIEGATPPASSGRSEKTLPLVRDPVCGTYVTQSRALSAGQGDATRYFCSERCRAEYVRTGRQS